MNGNCERCPDKNVPVKQCPVCGRQLCDPCFRSHDDYQFPEIWRRMIPTSNQKHVETARKGSMIPVGNQ